MNVDDAVFQSATLLVQPILDKRWGREQHLNPVIWKATGDSYVNFSWTIWMTVPYVSRIVNKSTVKWYAFAFRSAVIHLSFDIRTETGIYTFY